MNLIIDIGNTLQKIGIFSDEELIFYQVFENFQENDLHYLLKKYPVQYSILSSVIENVIEIETLLKSNTRYISFSHHSSLPIIVDYMQPETLGLDRIANAVAAQKLFPAENILSIQAGSCLVYDFIEQNGHYHGGAISPGIEMRFKALNHFTGKLPLFTHDEIDFFVGRSTQQSMKSGVINGVIHEIKGFITQYEKEYHTIKVLLSGGNAEYLQKSIKNAIFVGSNFILLGLHEILKLNVETT